MGVGSVLLAEEGVAQLPLGERMVTPTFSAAEASVIQAPACVLTVMLDQSLRSHRVGSPSSAVSRRHSLVFELDQEGERSDTNDGTNDTSCGIPQKQRRLSG